MEKSNNASRGTSPDRTNNERQEDLSSVNDDLKDSNTTTTISSADEEADKFLLSEND